jgi:hypothetical protein
MTLEITKGAAVTGPDQSIRLKAESNVLKMLGEGFDAVFQAQSAEDALDRFPESRLKDKLLSLTGRPGKKRTNLVHLGTDEVLEFEIVPLHILGAAGKDHLLIESVDGSSLVMRNDWDEKTYTGKQEASLSIVCKDLFGVGGGCVLVGPSYRWDFQYVKHFRPEDLKRLLYDQPLTGQELDGTTLGQVLEIHAASEPIFREQLMCSAFTKTGDDDVALVGAFREYAVRPGCGISFSFEHWPHTSRKMASGFGNPCLCVCHAFVKSIAANDKGETVLVVRLGLGRGNLPPFLKFNRMHPDSLLQTNLNTVVPGSCVLSVFQIKPVCVHTLAESTAESIPAFAAGPAAFNRDPFVSGHLEFELGPFQYSDMGKHDRPPGWEGARKQRYDDSDNAMAFALLSDYAAIGGPIRDGPFKELHDRWKAKYCDETTRLQGGRHLPKATLFPIAPLTPEQAFRQIHDSARLLESPRLDIYLQQLRTSVRNFFFSKTKPGSKPGKSWLYPNLPGSVLMQLVYGHCNAAEYTCILNEGAVEAVVGKVESAAELIGTPDGTFHFDESGIVECFGKITFRFLLYDAKRKLPESQLGAAGRAEVSFEKYVAKDRHGADLSGAVHDENDPARDQRRAAGPDGGMTRSKSSGGKRAHEADFVCGVRWNR